jgi:hypothetical protein
MEDITTGDTETVTTKMEKKPIILTFLTIFLVLGLLSFTAAHEAYYDNHNHFNTYTLDEYKYYEDDYYRYALPNYPSRNTYYSKYSGDYHRRSYNYRDNYYRSYRPSVFVGPLTRSYGHGTQDVYVRLDHYYNDDYYDDYYDRYNYYDDYYDRYNYYDNNYRYGRSYNNYNYNDNYYQEFNEDDNYCNTHECGNNYNIWDSYESDSY